MLQPLGLAYLAAADVRNYLFDRGTLGTTRARIPVLSVGNLTVGGTGKTPLSAWIANELRRRGAAPAIVMRGYGGDETLVHRVLAPGTPVIVSSLRVSGVERAATELGCDVAVLDDAFQHRSIARDVDIVLLGAEETVRPRRGLPAGPWRERLENVKRATLAVITRKTATDKDLNTVMQLIVRYAPKLPVAVARLQPSDLVEVDSQGSLNGAGSAPFSAMQKESVLAIAAIGNGRAFVQQIERGSAAMSAALFRDHHAFSDAEIGLLARRARSVDRVVCTLKDAVKLASRWPKSAPPLWYVSQEVIIERGADVMNTQLDALLAARQ
jgi:tetraacyldisaccharide 4'-kinase